MIPTNALHCLQALTNVTGLKCFLGTGNFRLFVRRFLGIPLTLNHTLEKAKAFYFEKLIKTEVGELKRYQSTCCHSNDDSNMNKWTLDAVQRRLEQISDVHITAEAAQRWCKRRMAVVSLPCSGIGVPHSAHFLTHCCLCSLLIKATSRMVEKCGMY